METAIRVISIVVGITTFFLLGWIWFRYVEEGKYGSKKRSKKIRGLGLLVIIIVPFVVGGVIHSQLGSSFLPATIYFDNGFDNSFEIVIDGEGEGLVSPLDLILLEVDRGDHEIEIRRNGELLESLGVNCKGEEDYIYNIGGRYTYFIVTHVYSSGFTTHRAAPKLIGSETFFRMPNVNYRLGGEVPDTVQTGPTTVEVTRTSVQRETR